MPTEQAPNTTTGNPFSLLAYLMFKVRRALTDQEIGNRPPRGVRIARGARFKDELIGKGIRLAVRGMANTLTLLSELTLDIEELLYQTDAVKAMGEILEKMVSAVNDEQFKEGIKAILDGDNLSELANLLGNDLSMGGIQQVLDRIPEPEDVRSLGHELYLLTCIVQQPCERDPSTNAILTNDTDLRNEEKQIDLAKIGKIWPLIWACNVATAPADHKKVKIRGLGPGENGVAEVCFLGVRRLWTDNRALLPHTVRSVWRGDDDDVDIYEYDFAPGVVENAPNHIYNVASHDFADLVLLLLVHGYNDPGINSGSAWALIRSNLMKFQFLNELPLTGELDNHTINRLFNLDFERKNLKRAVPYLAVQWPWANEQQPQQQPPPSPLAGQLQLVNPAADEYHSEAISLGPKGNPPNSYFVVPSTPGGLEPASVTNWRKGQGWLSEPNKACGFVGLRSRPRNLLADDKIPPSGADSDGRFVGGLYSEGEAAHGEYFWAARHTEPWRAGRTGIPSNAALFGGKEPESDTENGPIVSRMFQWVPLPDWLESGAPPLEGLKLYMVASVLQRSLFSDRNGSGYSDQGRIRLELHTNYTDTITPLAMPSPNAAVASSTTEWFPSHGETAAILDIALADRQRLWVLRRTGLILVPNGTKAACLIAEGRYQSGHDIDAYFDDFQIQFVWRA